MTLSVTGCDRMSLAEVADCSGRTCYMSAVPPPRSLLILFQLLAFLADPGVATFTATPGFIRPLTRTTGAPSRYLGRGGGLLIDGGSGVRGPTRTIAPPLRAVDPATDALIAAGVAVSTCVVRLVVVVVTRGRGRRYSLSLAAHAGSARPNVSPETPPNTVLGSRRSRFGRSWSRRRARTRRGA